MPTVPAAAGVGQQAMSLQQLPLLTPVALSLLPLGLVVLSQPAATRAMRLLSQAVLPQLHLCLHLHALLP